MSNAHARAWRTGETPVLRRNSLFLDRLSTTLFSRPLRREALSSISGVTGNRIRKLSALSPSELPSLFWDRFFQEMPHVKEWLVLTADGKPVPYGPQTFRYYWNRNHPDARDYCQRIVQFAVEEIRADLIHFDNYSVGPGYDACSAGLFREYLRTTFPQGQLAEMKLGEPDAIQPPRAGTPDIVRRAWEDFSCQALAQSYCDLSRYARSLRKDVLVELNPGGVGGRIHPPLDHGRLLPTSAPTPISGGLHFSSLNLGLLSACGVETSGDGYCWGSNGVGELGTVRSPRRSRWCR